MTSMNPDDGADASDDAADDAADAPDTVGESLPATLSEAPRELVYRAFVTDDDDLEQFAGRLVFDRETTLLTISEGADEYWADLERAVEALNSEAAIREQTAPKGLPRFTKVTRLVERSSPEFPNAIRNYLKRFHGIDLR